MMKKTAFILLVFVFLSGCARAPQRRCEMRLRVLDGITDTPIEGARVVVPETGECFYTDTSGLTPKMDLPVIPDPEYDELLPASEGRITFIVYAEGFTPYLLLYARTGRTRAPITALMFPDDGSLSVFTVMEAPPQEWAEELTDRWREQ